MCLLIVPSPLSIPPLSSYPWRTPVVVPAVVMAMDIAPASDAGVVAMEIQVRGALPVVEEDETLSAPPTGSEERLRYRRGGGRRRRGVPFNRCGYYMLIVIGEIGTEQQLDAARRLTERGEWRDKPPLWPLPRCDWVNAHVKGWKVLHKSSNRSYLFPFDQQRDILTHWIGSIGRVSCCSIAPRDST